MAWLYILALLVIPVADAMLLLLVFGPWLGAVETVALVVITALLGMVFVRAEGRRTLRKIQRSLAKGEPPTDELVDGGLLIAAGAFLLTPGFVTDLVGLVLVVPLTRYPIRLVLKKYVVTPYVDEKTGGFATGRIYTGGFPNEGGGFPNDDDRDRDDDYVDVDYEEK